MKIIIPAFLCLIACLVPFVPQAVLQPDILYWGKVSAAVLAALTVLTACFSLTKKPPEDYFKNLRKSEFETDEELAKRLTDKLESLVSENVVLVEGKDTLQVKLQEVLAELKEAKKTSAEAMGLQRDAQIDAELVNLLSILQEKGRLIDFFMDDITAYPDNQVGAAARVVHNGCAKVLKEYFQIAAISNAKEGENISLEAGYDSDKYRLVGKVSGEPPFSGKLLHHGWVVEKISLPRLLKNEDELKKHRVITAAEVELS